MRLPLLPLRLMAMAALLALLAILALAPPCQAAGAPVQPGIRPLLGIEAGDGPPTTEGLKIEAVDSSLPAGRMGMVRGDLLLSVNGSPVRSVTDLRAALLAMSRNQPLRVRYRHGDKEVEKEELPSGVPELPSYELLEGRGIKGSVMVGDTREQVEKALGKPRSESRRGSLLSLDYPRHGILVGLEPLEGQHRVMFVLVHFPFVGTTSRGLSTEGRRADIAQVYQGERIESGTDKSGNQSENLPALGLMFMCWGDAIVGTVLMPAEPGGAPAPPSP